MANQTIVIQAASQRLAGISGYEGQRMKTSIVSVSAVWATIVGTLALCLLSVPASAQDLTIFGGTQRHGKLTFNSAPGTVSNVVQTFDPMTFGVFGVRLGHGKVLGGEHTFAYAPNFIESSAHAVIYHSNLLVQAPLPVAKPYGTVGLGLVHSGGLAPSSFGTKFAVNYGGGLKVMAGPVGLGFDLRGYAVPRVSVAGFPVQQRLDFFQVSVGAVFTLTE